MKLSLVGVFQLYLAVFLALITASWLAFTWRRHRWSIQARRPFVCRACGEKILVEGHPLHVRCPDCGARQDKHQLQAFWKEQ